MVSIESLFSAAVTNDEERMDFIFAAFPLNPLLNPKQYSSKMDMWCNAVKNYCYLTNSSLVAYSDVHSIKNNGKSALALQTVWENLIKEGKLIPFEKYRGYLRQNWTQWTFNAVVYKPLQWTYSLFSNGSEPWKHEKFIFSDIFSSKTDALVAILKKRLTKGKTTLLIPYFDLAELSLDILPGDAEFDLALLHLQSKKYLGVFSLEDTSKIVKFSVHPGWRVPSVNSDEIAKINLEKTLKVLREDILRLEIRIDTTKKEAIVYGKAGDKRKAYRSLKRKHIIEKELDQKHVMELNLENMLDKIEDSHSLNLVIDAMKSSRDALKNGGVTLGSLDQTLDDVQEAMEIGQTFHDTMGASSKAMLERNGIFDDDLEAELEMLASTLPDESYSGVSSSGKSVTSNRRTESEFPNFPTGEPVMRDRSPVQMRRATESRSPKAQMA